MERSLPVFYNRRGNIVSPSAHSVIESRRGIFALARAGDAVMLVWPEFTKGIPELPGGGIDADETPEQALEREWPEETGPPFNPFAGPLKEYRQIRGFYAEDRTGENRIEGEFWVYEQVFRLYEFRSCENTGLKWRNPEGDFAGWEKRNALPSLPVHYLHWQGILALLPELAQENIAGVA